MCDFVCKTGKDLYMSCVSSLRMTYTIMKCKTFPFFDTSNNKTSHLTPNKAKALLLSE